MAKTFKVYWDSCAWLGFLNGETEKKRELELVYSEAHSKGAFEIWTSALTLVEVRRIRAEQYDQKPLSTAHLNTIRDVFRQKFVKTVPLDGALAEQARDVFRETPNLGKWQDAVHLVSAIRWNVHTLHTYDNKDLLHLDQRFECKDGSKLHICLPNATTEGPLFARAP